MIKLTEQYSIKTDGEGCSLQFSEPRMKEVTDKETKVKTKVPYIFNDEWHMLTVGQCLNRFLQLELENAEDVAGVVQKMGEVEKLIKNLKLEC